MKYVEIVLWLSGLWMWSVPFIAKRRRKLRVSLEVDARRG
jgi:hypothetical protein